MKKKLLYVLLACAMTFAMIGCGKKEEVVEEEPVVEDTITVEKEPEVVEEEEPVVEEVREGFYRSELTNEWIDESLKDQRPIAVMVDNEKTALAHYGTSQADVVYEMMNSTQNGRITRFMVLVKDWKNIERLGSIRSTRTTNLQIAPEWDAIVIHDGGPFYIDLFTKNPYVDHISGGFERFNNGKSREFTEYVTNSNTSEGIENKINNNNISQTYTQYYQGKHFNFASEASPIDLATVSDSVNATKVELPFPHNASKLEYMADTNTYRYSEYGGEYKDALTGSYLEFTNVILQECKHEQLDDHGYMNYFVKENAGMHGYYLTGGKAIPVTWAKQDDVYPTVFYDANGEEITINTGKTYIALVPSDVWSDLVVE